MKKFEDEKMNLLLEFLLLKIIILYFRYILQNESNERE